MPFSRGNIFGLAVFILSAGSVLGGTGYWLSRSLERERAETRTILTTLSGRIDALESKITELQDASSDAGEPNDPDDADQVITEVTYQANASMLDDPFVGAKQAPVLVMVFSNYQCKPCRLFHRTTFQELREKYVNNDSVQLVLRDFPIDTNEFAVPAATLAHCAGEGGGYWKMFDMLTENADSVDSGDLRSVAAKYDSSSAAKLMQCVQSNRYDEEIEKDRQDGVALGAKGAPGTFIGRRLDSGGYKGVFIRGAQPAGLIDREIRRLSHLGAAAHPATPSAPEKKRAK